MSNPGPEKNNAALAVAETRVEQILNEAAVLFRDKGFAGASMSDLARTVGVSKPALYHHFASKEELFVAVIVREPQAAADQMKAVAADPSLSASDKLRRVIGLCYDNIICSMAGQMMHTIAETSSRFPEIARRFRDGFIADQQGAFNKIIEDGIASGEFKSDHAECLCHLAFGPPMMISMTRAMYGHLADTPPIDIDNARRQHFEAMLRVLT
jgi:AcrR family transcriptional regulator